MRKKIHNYESENQFHKKDRLLNAKQDMPVKPQVKTQGGKFCPDNCNIFYVKLKYDNPIIDFIYNNNFPDLLTEVCNYKTDILGNHI